MACLPTRLRIPNGEDTELFRFQRQGLHRPHHAIVVHDLGCGVGQ